MSQPEEDLVWFMPAQMTSGAELLEVHNGPPWPGLVLVYDVPARSSAPSSLDLVAEFDARAAERKAKTAAEFKAFDRQRRAGGAVSIEGGVDARGVMLTPSRGIAIPAANTEAPSDLDSPTPAPRRKRRNKQEMREFRAAKQRQITDSYNSLVPAETRAWLDEPDPLLDSILDSTETSREKD